MELTKIKRMAAQVLGVGEKKVWINPAQRAKAMEAMTKDDVRGLIAERIVKKRPFLGQSRVRARLLKEKKKKGRKRGYGKRTGTFKARAEKKKSWIKNVRAQRKKLKELKEKSPEAFEKVSYRQIYNKVKGGFFRGKKYVEAAVKEGQK